MVPVLLVALLSGLAARPPGRVQQAPEPVCVVAHLPEGVEADRVTEELVRRLFLVRQRFWPDGSAAHPVNLPAASPVRDRFSRAIFGETVQEMVPYWNDRYFHGTRPPPTVASEAAVLLYLDRTPGGIGYVQGSATEVLPASVTRLFCTSSGASASGGSFRSRTLDDDPTSHHRVERTHVRSETGSPRNPPPMLARVQTR